MGNMRRIWIGSAAVLAVLAVPLAAWAGHGKKGLWKITVTTHMAGMQMPHMSAQEMAQMKAMGIHIPTSNTVTMQHCMTEAEVKADTPPHNQSPQSGCKTTNVKVAGHTMTADMVCTGEMKGKGHMRMTYDSPEHYKGKMTFQGTSGGQPVKTSNTMEGRWISADCGNVHH